MVTIIAGIGGAILGGIIHFVMDVIVISLGREPSEFAAVIHIAPAIAGGAWGICLMPYLLRWTFRISAGGYVIRFVRSPAGQDA